MAAPKWLSAIGHVIKIVFTSPKLISGAAGIADVLLPGFAPLINSAASAIITAETSAAAAGIQSGTGVQKMAYAVSLFTATYNAWAAENGLAQEPAAVQALLQQVFNLLEQFQLSPAVAAQVAASNTTPTTAAAPVAAVQN